jgi:hypothetical protein
MILLKINNLTIFLLNHIIMDNLISEVKYYALTDIL